MIHGKREYYRLLKSLEYSFFILSMFNVLHLRSFCCVEGALEKVKDAHLSVDPGRLFGSVYNIMLCEMSD